MLLLNLLFKSYDVAKVVIFDVLPSFFGPQTPDDGIAREDAKNFYVLTLLIGGNLSLHVIFIKYLRLLDLIGA